MVWRGCLVLDSYESGMERMSCFEECYGEDHIHMRVVWRGCLVLDSYEEWYGEDVLF